MSASLFEVPLYFISEYFNGWVIVILVIIIIYFVALRNYYLKREQFFDKSMRLKEINEIEDIEEKITNNYNEYNGMKNINQNKKKNNKDKNNKDKNNTDKNNQNNQNTIKLKGNDIFEKFEVMSTTSASAKYDKTPLNLLSVKEEIVSTTLFNNLNLNSMQLQSCLMNYNEVINKYMSDLRKLNELKIKNEYLNIQKQFDAIILNGIDNIVNYLNNVIKSPNILTRTSIRTDVINTLSTNIENLINKANNDLSIEINKLAKLDSTTINYEIMMKSIYDSRRNIENYIELDKFVSTYGRNISNYNRNINDILNKSNLLPIYESNFDKINQLINSDYNDDETKMSNKYGKAYTDYLSQMKKEDLDVNPMRLASQIESGIVNMLSNLYGSDNKNVSKYGKANNREDNGEDNEEDNEDIIEQYNREYGNNNIKINNIKSNVIPKQQSNLVNNTNLNENANIYKDRGNLGSYLLDRNTQKQILEGFVDDTTTNNTTTNTTTNNPSTTNPSTTKPNINNVNGDLESKNKSKKTADIISSLLSGDFLQYVMEIMNEKLNMLYGMYNTKFNTNDYDKNGNKSNNSTTLYGNFKIEENMIPAGFLLFILSMFVYFIDTTS